MPGKGRIASQFPQTTPLHRNSLCYFRRIAVTSPDQTICHGVFYPASRALAGGRWAASTFACIFSVVAALHKKQACARQVGCYGQVNTADTIRAPECFKVKGFCIVDFIKGKPCRFNGFPHIKFLAQNAGQFAAVLLCPLYLLRQVIGFLYRP